MKRDSDREIKLFSDDPEAFSCACQSASERAGVLGILVRVFSVAGKLLATYDTNVIAKRGKSSGMI